MTYAHNPFRLINLNFIMIFTVPLAGWVLYTLRDSGRKVLSRVVIAIIVLCLVSTVFTVYQDPDTVFPNGSVTRSEIAGANWLVTDKDTGEFTFFTVQTLPWRYSDLTYGAAYKRANPEIVDRDRTTTAHFASFLGANSTVPSTAYLVLTMYEEMGYSLTWAHAGKYNMDDFHKLTYRPTVDQVYKGGSFNVYARSLG
jgi:hypothetical protein